MSDMSTRRRGESAIAILNHKVQYERELSRSMNRFNRIVTSVTWLDYGAVRQCE